MARWSRNLAASAGANSEPSICSTIDADTMSPAVPPSTPRSRRMGASQAKTLKDIMACSTIKMVTCQATGERHTFTPSRTAWCRMRGWRRATGRNNRRTTAAGTAQDHSARVHSPVAV
ncbi:hypothetical protein D3C85_1561580 [compost metagenome]